MTFNLVGTYYQQFLSTKSMNIMLKNKLMLSFMLTYFSGYQMLHSLPLCTNLHISCDLNSK